MNEAALQYLIGDARSWEQTANVWENAYNELADRHAAYIADTKRRLEAAQREVESAKKKSERRWGFGFFGGVGTGGATIGVGFVWRVI